MSLSEHVSGAGAAKFPLTAQTYFCDSWSPLRDLPLPLRSRSPDFWPAPLQFCSAPVPMCLKQQTEKVDRFYRACSYDNAV